MTILLKGGLLLLHDDNDHVVPTRADLLIEGSCISRIGEDLHVPSSPSARVIECKNKIISPGFISTHSHLWQTQLKGRHVDQTLLEYFPSGNFPSSLYSPYEAFFGQLSGALEYIDAGTTTVVDHSHIVQSPEHAYETLRATVTSGIRAVWCYMPGRRVTSWSPFEFAAPGQPWEMPTFKELAAKAPFAGDRVRLGFAWDGLSEPAEALKVRYAEVREAGAHLITSHATYGGPMFGHPPSIVQLLHSRSLLAPDILLSHATSFTPADAALLAASGAHTSSTPHTELQMGMGHPIALRSDQFPHASIGVDCHSAGPASMPMQAALLLQDARATWHDGLHAGNEWARSLGKDEPLSVEDAFNLCTVKGGRAAGLADQVGRLKEGFRADVVVFDALSPALLGCEDMVGGIILHSHPGCIDMVIVDGVARKKDRVLLDIIVSESLGGGEEGVRSGEKLGWADVAKRTLETRKSVYEKLEVIDQRVAEQGVIEAFHLARDLMREA